MKIQTLSRFFMPIVISLLFITCDKDDPKPAGCFLSTAEYEEADIDINQFFKYTYENGRAKQFIWKVTYPGIPTMEYTVTLQYDTKGNISEFTYPGGFRNVFTYNGSNQLIKTEEFEGNELEEYSEHEYANGKLVKIQYYEKSFSGETLVKSDYEVFEYSDASSENPQRIKYYDSFGALYQTSEFEYDDKKNPYHADPALFRIASANGESKNNIKKESTSIPGASTSVSSSAIDYNSQGYPVKIVTTRNDSGSTATSSSTFTYNCQ